MTALFEIEGLTVRYPRTARAAVDTVDLEIREGEFLCIVGESGSGKTTLALACLRLLGEDVDVTGSIRLGKKDLLLLSKRELREIRGREIGFVYQDALTSFSPLCTVGGQISETIRAHEPCSRSDAWERTLEQLATVRLSEPDRIARSYPHELSGGQRQRAAIAMALALRPRLLIADEPTSALDVTTAAHILALLKELQSELGISVLLITHDMHVVEAVADRIGVMYAGVIGELGDSREVRLSPRYPYTKALIDSLDLDRPRGGLAGIPGAPPGLSELIAGCPFAPRCPRAGQPCRVSLPPVLSDSGPSVRCFFPLVSVPTEAHAGADR